MLYFVSRKILLNPPPPKILANICHVPNKFWLNFGRQYLIIFIDAYFAGI
jgi:hypothetical protein